ncbi:hypothetical protein BT69DRAFT_1210280, partial [Atractiella rhizophila]
KDIVTRWNSLYDCIERALLLKAAFKSITEMSSYGFQKYALTESEWAMLDTLK